MKYYEQLASEMTANCCGVSYDRAELISMGQQEERISDLNSQELIDLLISGAQAAASYDKHTNLMTFGGFTADSAATELLKRIEK